MVNKPCEPEVPDHEISQRPRGRRLLPTSTSAGNEKGHGLPAANSGSTNEIDNNPSREKCFTDAPSRVATERLERLSDRGKAATCTKQAKGNAKAMPMKGMRPQSQRAEQQCMIRAGPQSAGSPDLNSNDRRRSGMAFNHVGFNHGFKIHLLPVLWSFMKHGIQVDGI